MSGNKRVRLQRSMGKYQVALNKFNYNTIRSDSHKIIWRKKELNSAYLIKK